MNVSELRLGGLIFDHHHVSCFRRDELQDGAGGWGGGGEILVFLQEKKTFCKFKWRSELSNNDSCMGKAA